MTRADLIVEKLCGVSVGGYSVGKIISFIAIKDSWHFQALQELAFAAAIVSCFIAVLTFLKKYNDSKKTNRKGKS